MERTDQKSMKQGQERESQETVAGVLLTQNHLFTSAPKFSEEADDTKPSPSAGIDVNASMNWVH